MRIGLLILMMLIASKVWAHGSLQSNDSLMVDRYVSVSTKPSDIQTDLLSVLVTFRFGTDVQTVGAAMQQLLINSGYRLADLRTADPDLPILLDAQLPQVHRSIGPISLRDALTTLAGSSWVMVTDPVHRLISFDLKSIYQTTPESTHEVKEVSDAN